MQNNKILPIAIALLMFPQVAQTLYSPALADFSQTFSIAPALAAQALTVYFLAFALGVVVWGRMCDRYGRRPSMLCGLALFAVASTSAIFVTSFRALLCSQAVAAFGAAVGSVVTQTILRDRFNGSELAKAFSIAGMVLASSPAVGLLIGATVVHHYGYQGVMIFLVGTVCVLILWAAADLPETMPTLGGKAVLLETIWMMVRDVSIWRSALLVAVLNVALVGYYALGPFMFQRLNLSSEIYGYSGAALAAGAAIGSWLNRRLLRLGAPGDLLIGIASGLILLGGIGVQMLQDRIWFLVPMLLVVIAFGLAIPNVLGKALCHYQDRLGTAGAVLGLMYYLMIGAGMGWFGASQNLGGSLIATGMLALLLSGASLSLWKPKVIPPPNDRV